MRQANGEASPKTPGTTRCLCALLLGVLLPSTALLAQGSSRAAPAFPAEELPLTGFRYLWIEPPTYDGGRVDYMNLKRYLERQLSEQSWIFLSASELQRLPQDGRIAGVT